MPRLQHYLDDGRAVFGGFIELRGEAAELCSAGQPGAAVPTWISALCAAGSAFYFPTSFKAPVFTS
jgi:hypothetical protein